MRRHSSSPKDLPAEGLGEGLVREETGDSEETEASHEAKEKLVPKRSQELTPLCSQVRSQLLGDSWLRQQYVFIK